MNKTYTRLVNYEAVRFIVGVLTLTLITLGVIAFISWGFHLLSWTLVRWTILGWTSLALISLISAWVKEEEDE